jgi:hypothetical protein
MSAETAVVLEEAANIIRRNGFHKGSMFRVLAGTRAAECPVCTWGALAIAACGTPELPTNREVRQVLPVVQALARFLGLGTAGEDAMWTIPDWNDAPDRTAEQVINALESAAQAEREASS